MNNIENIIEIRDLKKSYDNGKIKAINGMELEVRKGEFISIMDLQDLGNHHSLI